MAAIQKENDDSGFKNKKLFYLILYDTDFGEDTKDEVSKNEGKNPKNLGK